MTGKRQLSKKNKKKSKTTRGVNVLIKSVQLFNNFTPHFIQCRRLFSFENKITKLMICDDIRSDLELSEKNAVVGDLNGNNKILNIN